MADIVVFVFLLKLMIATVEGVCDWQVLTEGRLILEFTFDDLMRIRMWHFAMRQHCELIPRGVIASLQVMPSPSKVSK